jgi:hypothetical protein
MRQLYLIILFRFLFVSSPPPHGLRLKYILLERQSTENQADFVTISYDLGFIFFYRRRQFTAQSLTFSSVVSPVTNVSENNTVSVSEICIHSFEALK